MENQKLRLHRVEIEGFRGVNRALRLDFGERATLLFAPNGQGKTSVLGAIEWCIFGELAYQMKENSTNDEVVNLHHPTGESIVRIVLGRGTNEVVVERRRRIGKRDTTLHVTTEAGEIVDGSSADRYLFRLLGLTFDDFYRASFLHQESVRGLLVDEPRVRNEALDRLFGLDKLRDILAAIQIKPVTEAIDDIRGKQARAYDKLSGASQILEVQRHRHLQEAQAMGLVEPDLTLGAGLELARAAIRTLRAFEAENGIAAREIADPESVDDLERVVRGIKQAIRDNRLSGVSESPIGPVSGRLTQLEAEQRKLESAKTGAVLATEEVEKHEQEHGMDGALGQRKADLATRREGARQAIGALETTARLLGDAMVVLRADPATTLCPVCHQSINVSALLGSLEARTSGAGGADHGRLTADFEGATAELEGIGRTEQVRSSLRGAQTRALDDYERAVVDARRTLPSLPVGTEAIAFIESETSAVRAQLGQANSMHQNREHELDELDQSVDKLRALQKVAKDDEDSAGLAARVGMQSDEGEDDALTEELSRLGSLQQSLQLVAQAVQGVARSRASEAVDSSRAGTAEYYKTLCNHPYFDRLRIDVQEKMLAGIAKNNYMVRVFSSSDGRDTLAGSRLSTAQMNCVALSIYLGLAGVLAHNLGFIILDDPSQNLDSSHKSALAGVLGSLLSSVQVLVSTQDVELERSLRERFGNEGVVTYRLAWVPREGTSATAV